MVLDPHNEYAAAFGDRALRLDPSNLELPYWLLTFEEIAVVLTSGVDGRGYGEGVILRDAILRAKQIYRGGDADQPPITVDTPVPYRLSDLARVIEDGMGTLNKPEAATAYRQILAVCRASARIAATASCSSRSICATISTPSSAGCCACRWRASR